MKFNKWTLGLAAVGAVSLTSAVTARADGAGNMNQWGAAQNGLTITGAISTSVNVAASPGGSDFDDSPAGGVPLQSGKQDGFNLDVVELNFAKPMGEEEYASGFLVQVIMGPDAVGWNPSANGNQDSDFALKQAYVALRSPIGNGIDWKIGAFDTIIGFESFEAWNNPNYTRSWGWGLEPTQHTGILGSYRFTDSFSMSAGIANTLTTGINTRDTGGNFLGDDYWNKTWLLSATYKAPDSWGVFNGSTLSAGIVRGANELTGESSQMNVYAGVVIPNALDHFTFGAAFDYVEFDDLNNTKAATVGLYTSWKATEKLSLHGRFEAGSAQSDENDADVSWYGLTGTVEYALWSNVISRLEIRHEIADDDVNPANIVDVANGVAGAAYDHPSGTAIYLNIIYKFL